MRRRFSSRQRLVLGFRSGGRCELCGSPLLPSFHADHRIPYASGGPTTLMNGQATCPKCNLIKGKKMIKLRDWQQAARTKALDYLLSTAGNRHFVVNAAPGAGKTKLACVIAADLLGMGEITRVVVIAPRKTVVDQWADEFERLTGRHMRKVTAADGHQLFSKDICATWAAVKDLQDAFQAICASDRVLVICDEHHHAAIEAAWGAAADSAFRDAEFAVILTGTPIRSDGASSVWLDLNDVGALSHPEAGMYSLSYGEAVELGYCRPASFHRHRGKFTVDLGNGQEALVTSDGPPVIPPHAEVDAVLRRIVDFQRLARIPQFEADLTTPRLDGYQGTMIAAASAKLDEARLDLPNAGGLVIAHDIEMAEYFARLIKRLEGQEAMIVHSNVSNPDGRILAFKRDASVRWLVAVGMVSEGVDIQRLRVLVYLPAAMTELAFRQAIGRVVRNAGPDDHSRAYVVMPALRAFDEFARRIEEDMPAFGPSPTACSKQKRCALCSGGSSLNATDCEHCGAEFPSRASSGFLACDCGVLNRVGETNCLNCGSDLLGTHRISLAEAARDGVISRGIEVPEEDVIKAEALAPVHRAMLANVERQNKAVARLLRTVPLELWPEFVKLVRQEFDGSGT